MTGNELLVAENQRAGVGLCFEGLSLGSWMPDGVGDDDFAVVPPICDSLLVQAIKALSTLGGYTVRVSVVQRSLERGGN